MVSNTISDFFFPCGRNSAHSTFFCESLWVSISSLASIKVISFSPGGMKEIITTGNPQLTIVTGTSVSKWGSC